MIVWLTSHIEAVIWCGDFNYRIGLGLERAHELVRKKDLERLYENDQVRPAEAKGTGIDN